MARKKLKKPKATGKNIVQRMGTFVNNNIFLRINFLAAEISQRVEQLVPVPYRWIMQIVQDELGIEIPTSISPDELKKKLTGKSGEEQEGEEGAVAVVEEIAPLVRVPPKVAHIYPQYPCVQGNPFQCQWVAKTLEEQPEASYCSRCEFPTLLPIGKEIKGVKGKYQIQEFLGIRSNGRYYLALRLPERQSIILKEYLLPLRCFDYATLKQRKEVFKNFVGRLQLSDNRVQDFRLINPTEAIVDQLSERCYLIFNDSLYKAPSLANYINENGRMSNLEVLQVLKQVLQSLQFLHSQKFRLPGGIVETGLVHGNLSLETLLITPSFQGFYIYLSDVSLWEELANPAPLRAEKLNLKQDLTSLGYIAFYLLAGGVVNLENGLNFDPRKDQDWHSQVNPQLKEFILNLLGLGRETYPNAEIARRHIPQLSIFQEGEAFADIEPEADEDRKPFPWRLLLFSSLGLIILALLFWFFGIRNRGKQPVTEQPGIVSIKEVTSIPLGEYNYLTEPNSIWNYIFTKPGLISNEITFAQKLAELQPLIRFRYRLVESPILESLSLMSYEQPNPFDFAITTLLGDFKDIGVDFESETFAYDGLVTFVNFSYAERKNSLPQRLNGKISFKQLRQLYTGEITNWQDLGGPDLPVKLYAPLNDEALRIFEKRVLQDDRSIAKFRNLIALNQIKTENTLPQNESLIKTNPESPQTENQINITRLDTTSTLRAVIRDFENPEQSIGSIGFDALSKVFGQCAVYPLALQDDRGRTFAPLELNSGNKLTPKTDLCRYKGNYRQNQDLFIDQKYPLTYPLAIIYPRDNRREQKGRKLAEILKTQEMQCLLQDTGLIPLETNLNCSEDGNAQKNNKK